MKKRATIKDVAALAGVSAATVSRALDDRPEISTETKESVRAACAVKEAMDSERSCSVITGEPKDREQEIESGSAS